MTSIPIIFFHYGNSDYLKYSLKQARFFNPHSEIYLLGDKKNDRYDFLTHIQASKYKKETEAFAGIYKHMSSNDEGYELNCFLRWFYICAFCKENNIGQFIYLDSDVLLYEDISTMLPFFEHSTIANTCDTIGVPAFTYFNGYQAIHSFCDFLLYSYTNNKAIQNLQELYAPFLKDPTIMGGISDMTLFHIYFQEHPAETMKINLINNDLAIDICINNPDGYEMENGMKKIYWQNNLPYGKDIATHKLVRFASLHYQGHAKDFIRRHYKVNGYVLHRLWESLKIKARFKKIKRSIKALFK